MLASTSTFLLALSVASATMTQNRSLNVKNNGGGLKEAKPIDLFHVMNSATPPNVPVCSDKKTISCQLIRINTRAFFSGGNIRIKGTLFSKVAREGQTTIYTEAEKRMTASALVRRWPNRRVTASMEMHDGHYTIEPCGGWRCNILVKTNVSRISQDPPTLKSRDLVAPRALSDKMIRELEMGIRDRTTQVEMTITFYATPSLKKGLLDAGLGSNGLEEAVKTMLEEANLIFVNNGIPLKVVAKCILTVDFDEPRFDLLNTEDALLKFKAHRGSVENLLNGADAAVLVTSRETIYGDNIFCGFANDTEYFRNTMEPIFTVSFLCENWVFIRNLARIMGARADDDTDHEFARAYVLFNRDGTIMSKEKNVNLRMPIFSKPPVGRYNMFEACPGGLQIGADNANNKRLLIENRYVVSGFGSEDRVCGANNPTTTTTTTTTTTPKLVTAKLTTSGPTCEDKPSAFCLDFLCLVSRSMRTNCKLTCGLC